MKRWKYVVLALSLVSLSGCKFVRPTDADNRVHKDDFSNLVDQDVIEQTKQDDNDETSIPVTENPVSVLVGYGDAVDYEALVRFFYKESTEDLKEEGYLEESENSVYSFFADCEKDDIELDYSEWKNGHSEFRMFDNEGDAGRRYHDVLNTNFFYNEVSQRMIDLYPEKDLDSAAREEAIAFCAPLAEACGYGDAQVNVYAITKETMNNYSQLARAYVEPALKRPPYAEFEKTVTLADIMAATKAGNEELAEELKAIMEAEQNQEIPPWTDESEGYLLVYRTVLNRRLMDCTYFSMWCVYMPAYQKVVYAYGERSMEVTETLEEVNLISEEEALAEALRVAKIDSVDKITLKRISMVYSPRYDQARVELERRIVDPCWRIDYELNDELKNNATVALYDDGTILINAVDGRENKYPRG